MSERPEMFEGTDTIWMDGEFLNWDDAQVHVLTHALHYGTGVFEGVRCYDTVDGPAIFRWDAHLERFFQSGQVYDIEMPFDREEITEATLELIRRQDLESCSEVETGCLHAYGTIFLRWL